LPGIDCCYGNIPVGKPVVLPLGKIGLGQGFWIGGIASLCPFIIQKEYHKSPNPNTQISNNIKIPNFNEAVR
jgi:hypothetical protein